MAVPTGNDPVLPVSKTGLLPITNTGHCPGRKNGVRRSRLAGLWALDYVDSGATCGGWQRLPEVLRARLFSASSWHVFARQACRHASGFNIRKAE